MLLFSEKTDIIIKCFYKVYNTLGHGFLEKVYGNAMVIELQKSGLHAQSQLPIDIFYAGSKIGIYFSDILVDNVIILELKAGDGDIIKEHELQLINYVKATRLNIGFILHFGKKPSFKRKIFTSNQLPP